MRHVLSEIRLNHARTNIIITVDIAISPAPKKKPRPGRCNNLRCFYIDQCDSSSSLILIILNTFKIKWMGIKTVEQIYL